MNVEKIDLNAILQEDHFKNVWPLKYNMAWYSDSAGRIPVLWDDMLYKETENNSWSAEIEAIHEEPTKNGWIDVYERENVINTVSNIICEGVIIEFGSSSGYMIEEMRNAFPNNIYIATDLMSEGLKQSFSRNEDIMHIQCDFTDAPFRDNSVDFIYSLNVLEHIENDIETIRECYRVLKPGGWCLFVVPRGENLYDYFDEMLFHKRRYGKGELREKCKLAGFQIKDNFHFAWLCYPVFWLKKKWNRHVGKGLSNEEKISRVKQDIDSAMESPLAIGLMHFEHFISKVLQPSFGVREFILCKKE